MNWANPNWFWALCIMPVIFAVMWRAEAVTRRRVKEFLPGESGQQMLASVSWWRRRLRHGFFLCGLILVILALAGPQWGKEERKQAISGRDVLFALDVSLSMQSFDVSENEELNYSRLTSAKLAAVDLVKSLSQDRVGVIGFAGGAVLMAPLTVDHGAVIETIKGLNTDSIGTVGTHLASAINEAKDAFEKSESNSQALILFSDGEEWTEETVTAAKEAAEANIRIFTVGVGTLEGGRIPVQDRFGRRGFHRDRYNQVVETKLDESLLRQVASLTGGTYFRLENSVDLRRDLRTSIMELSAASQEGKTVQQVELIDRYQWPLGAGLFLLLISFLVTDRKGAASRRRQEAANRPRAVAPTKPSQNSSAPAGALGLWMTGCLITAFFSIAPSAAFAQRETDEEKRETAAADPEVDYLTKVENVSPLDPRLHHMQFNAGVDAYRDGSYDQAMQAFSKAIRAEDKSLQEKSHYNLGNALFQKALENIGSQSAPTPQPGAAEEPEIDLKETLTSAIEQYDTALELNSRNEAAKANKDRAEQLLAMLEQQQEQQQQQAGDNQPEQEESEDNQDKQQQEQEQEQQQQSGDNSEQQSEEQDQAQEQQEESEQEENQNEDQQAEEKGEQEEQSESGEQDEKEQNQQSSEQPEDRENEQQQESPESRDQQDQSTESESQMDREAQEQEQPERDEEAEDNQEKIADSFELPEESPSDTERSAQTAAAEETPPDELTEEMARMLLQNLETEEARAPYLERRPRGRRPLHDW